MTGKPLSPASAIPSAVRRRLTDPRAVDPASAPTNEDADGQGSPFRRCYSKPEAPTSHMGEEAIALESRATRHASDRKLTFLRRFSVSEQDIVVCNRVRCGVDPTWLRQRNGVSPRYQRSLSIEEARLAATQKRLSTLTSRRRSANLADIVQPRTLVVPEDMSLESPPTLTRVDAKVASPRRALEAVDGADLEIEAEPPTYHPAQLTPREKAMHGRYLIRESFANGSYGQVCAGEAVPSKQEVAVKIIPKYVLISPEEKQSVIREQVIHKSLDHPHIIKLIDVFEDDGAHYFVLERADNGSLSTLMTYAGMPEPKCREVFRQLLQALDYLHRHRIVHHDIKPNNILLHKGNSAIKLCDFGASRAFNPTDASLPFAGVFGTPGYIAPELLMADRAYGPAIDMFSAGILLFEMVFGYLPFYPPSACTYQPVEFPTNVTASPEVKCLILQLLEKDPLLRITATQALVHPWVTQVRSTPTSPVAVTPSSASHRPLERCMTT